jgi:putative transposase
MPWQDFYAFISAEIDAYNNRPHRSLPRVRDSETGKMRHMSPNERWGDCIASGWQPDRLSESELVRYRRPSEVRTTRRGLVQIGGGDYFHQDLAIYHDDNVIVAFDIHDTSRVWVSDMEGRHICEAELDGHSRPYMPRSYVEQAREKRLAGQEKRVRDKLTVIENERDAGRVIEHRPAPQQTIPAEEIARLAADFERADDAVVVPLGNDVDRLNRFRRVCQGIAYGDEVSEADRAWVAGYVKTPEGQRNLEVMRDLDASLADLDFGGTDAG